MDVNVCFSAHRDGSIHLQDDYWGSRHLSELGETKIYCATKNMLNHLHEGKRGQI